MRETVHEAREAAHRVRLGRLGRTGPIGAANLILSPAPDDCDSPCGSSAGIILATAFACLELAFLVLVALTIAWTVVAWGVALWRRVRR